MPCLHRGANAASMCLATGIGQTAAPCIRTPHPEMQTADSGHDPDEWVCGNTHHKNPVSQLEQPDNKRAVSLSIRKRSTLRNPFNHLKSRMGRNLPLHFGTRNRTLTSPPMGPDGVLPLWTEVSSASRESCLWSWFSKHLEKPSRLLSFLQCYLSCQAKNLTR